MRPGAQVELYPTEAGHVWQIQVETIRVRAIFFVELDDHAGGYHFGHETVIFSF